MTGYLWTAQDPGSMRRAKTGFGVQAGRCMSRTCLAPLGLPPLAVSVLVCRDGRYAGFPSACSTGVMRHDVGLRDLALLSRSCPTAMLR